MNADANQDPWSQRLSLTTLAPELSLLALRSLGIPLDILGSIFNFDRLQLLATSQAGLRLGRNLKVRPSDEHGFDISPFGLDELAQLLAQDIPDTVHQKFDFQWARGPLVDVARQEDVPGGPHHILRPDPGFDAFLEDVCGFFLGPRCLKLLLLLPRPQGASDAFGWDVLRVGEPPRDWHPVRLLGTLAMLGLTHNTAGHRTQVLPEIIDRWQALSDQVAVVGRRCSTTRHDPIWCSQMKGLAAGTILLPPMKRPSSLGKPQACPFVVDFCNFWKKQPYRYSDWAIQEDEKDADELADALGWLMPRSSGVCIVLSLPPKASTEKTHDIRVIGPDPWLDFMRSGHGHLRKNQTFEPYRGLEQPGVTLYSRSTTMRFQEIKDSIRPMKYLRK